MAKWANAMLLDGGSDLLRTLAGTAGRIKQHVIKAYAAGDSYSTVTGNSCGSVDMAAEDFVQSGAPGSARTTTISAKSITSLSAGSGSAPDLHIALVDSLGGAVLLVTSETTDQVLTAANQFNIPAWTYAVDQPA